MKIGIIGTGTMGKPMARNLLKAKFSVGIFARHPEKAQDLKKEGARLLPSAAEVSRESDCILLSLPFDPEVEEVVSGEKGVLAGAAELYVERRDEQWSWCQGEPSRAELSERIDGLQQGENLPVGYISEINLAAEAWVASMSDILTAGMLLLVDYGFPRREYYHPQRNSGTLMCHYRHRAHGDPFILVGLQDITAHVEFTALAETAHAAGMRVAGYTTQAAFLLAQGITGFMSEADDELTRLQLAQQIKKLTMPHEMGDLFKVLALTRDFDEPLRGLALRDMRDHL